MNDLQKFFASCLDTADIGLEANQTFQHTVFTPVNALVIGQHDHSIHFCQLDGGMILAIDPNAAPGEAVIPVANSFSDFLGLILACKGVFPILQAMNWSSRKFADHLQNLPLSSKQKSILRAVENIYHPPKIRDPYAYLSSVREGFDFDSLALHPDYDEHCPVRPGKLKWMVCFNSDFFPLVPDGRVCKERPIDASFEMGGEQWHIPAIYTCDRGIVVDCIEKIPMEEVQTFLDNWKNLDSTMLNRQQRLLQDAQRPGFHWMDAALKIGSNTIHNYTSYQLSWNPFQCNDWKSRKICAHYGLDLEEAWVIRRYCFTHRIKKKTTWTPLSIHLKPEEISIPGPSFTADQQQIDFVHPISGQSHQLTVQNISQEALDPNFLYDPPCYYNVLTYKLEPPLSTDAFLIQDTVDNDPLRAPVGKTPDDALIIGGADGPTALFFTPPKSKHPNTVASSLHYEPVDQVIWQMIFKEKKAGDLMVELLK